MTTATLRVVRSSHPVFDGVENPVVEKLLNESILLAIGAEECLVKEGDPAGSCFVVETGSIRLYSSSDDGIQVTHQVLRAPAVYGVSECLLGLAYTESAQALEKTTVRAISKVSIDEAARSSHALAFNLLKDTSARLCVATNRQKTSALYNVGAQLAHFFVTYADAFGLPVVDGIQIRIPLSQSDLGNMLGVTSRSVARALHDWTNDGILTKRGRHFVLRDPARLAMVSRRSLSMVFSSDLPQRDWAPKVVAPMPQLRQCVAARTGVNQGRTRSGLLNKRSRQSVAGV